MKKQIKKVVDNIKIALIMKATNVGGAVVTLDATPIDGVELSNVVKDNFNFTKSNNLMEADWGNGPEVVSSRFGDQKDWDKRSEERRVGKECRL